VRVGSLVYCAGYRHPAVLANAIATIDHLSGGRADLGLGAGWAFNEYAAYGIPFPSAGERLDLLEESIQAIRGLLRQEVTDFTGNHVTLTEARCEPKPIQDELPIWVGGSGEKRTLRIAARYADGWNVPFVAPDVVAHKRAVLAGHCADVGRDPSEIRTAVNVGLCEDDDALRAQFGQLAEGVRPGVLIGSPDQLVQRIGEYVEAGADQINIAMRAPWDLSLLDLATEAIEQLRAA
jgi:alkanesulfonate monooxygenase SsuD/methylene tetrahydromethanopterin reductase-like flavin-dependent oxidoreductase (luciferase family)